MLITNNDVKADKNVIKSLVEVAEKDKMICFVTGKVYYYDNPVVLQSAGKYEDPLWLMGGHIGWNQKDNGQYDFITEIPYCDDIYWLVSREVYLKCGGYDEDFFLMAEDFDWQVRAKSKGFKIFYTPNAKIWHKESMTIGKKSVLKEFYVRRNPIIVILKHKSANHFKKVFWNFFKVTIIMASLNHLRHFRIKRFFLRYRILISVLKYGLKNKLLTLKHFFI